MSEIFGGNMAFPIHNTGHGAPFDEGMTLRDYFAAKAMQAIIAHPDSDGDKPPVIFAKVAYKMADAMMEYRDSGE